jgi:hypothetical protein
VRASWAVAVAICTVIAVTGCGRRRRPDEVEPPPRWTWAEPRAAYLARSEVWIGGDLRSWVRHMRTLDLAAGPGGVTPGTLVECAYVAPKPGLFSGGATPKFVCRNGSGTDATVKIKYGADNGEIYAEVAGSRLMWALGFVADRVDPVRVRCTGCADDPARPGTAPGPRRALRSSDDGASGARQHHRGAAAPRLDVGRVRHDRSRRRRRAARTHRRVRAARRLRAASRHQGGQPAAPLSARRDRAEPHRDDLPSPARDDRG